MTTRLVNNRVRVSKEFHEEVKLEWGPIKQFKIYNRSIKISKSAWLSTIIQMKPKDTSFKDNKTVVIQNWFFMVKVKAI